MTTPMSRWDPYDPGMGRPVEFERSSVLAAPAGEVWQHATSMSGVNDELGPWVRMTYPEQLASLADADDSALGTVVFHSWLLAGGRLPFDRHALRLVEIDSRDDGGGFVEESTSWLQSRWRHERDVVALGDDRCLVTDRLTVVPRIPLARPVVAVMVPWLFTRRHRRLLDRFGRG